MRTRAPVVLAVVWLALGAVGCAKEGGFRVDGGPFLRPDAFNSSPAADAGDDAGIFIPEDSGEPFDSGEGVVEDTGVIVEEPDSGIVEPADAGFIPSPMSSFFVTSLGNNNQGGSLGGLVGADNRCASLAANAQLPVRVWKAYLSSTVEDASRRIGTGPWYNVVGTMVATSTAALHANSIASNLMLDELGGVVPVAEHDIPTGSTRTGTVAVNFTCNDWTSDTNDFVARVGHTDWQTSGVPNDSWISSHNTTGCSGIAFSAAQGTGRIYCFAE